MKVLLLSLGVGALDKREISDKKEYGKRQILGEGVFPYRTAYYRFHGEEKIYKSPFVAEPLIDRFKPDVVVLIGTVRSCWSSFYAKYAATTEYEKKSTLALSLFESEETHGLNTPASELNAIEKKIKRTLDELNILGDEKPVKLIPVLILYGLADGDTRETYSKISRVLKEVFDHADSVEVAFDITHSFRSMPIYNLTVVNYFSNLQNKPIDITHVYYGNLDVSGENNGVAEIIDLKDMVDILKLTSGVSEFKNTGSTLTLSNHMQDERLKELLEEFDFSTQTNAFDDIDASIGAILDYMDEAGEQKTRNADLTDMLKAALGRALVDMDALEAEYWKGLPFWAKQYAMGKWFLHQKRYGLAVLVGTEAVRSGLASIYIKGTRDRLGEEEIIGNENFRRDAIERLKRERYLVRKSKISDGLESLLCWYNKCVPIRNRAAHNLSTQGMKTDIEIIAKDSSAEIRNKIEKLFECLTWLKTELESDRENLSQVYNTEVTLTDYRDPDKAKQTRKRVVITDCNKRGERLRRLTKSNTNKYAVYYPDDEVRELLRKDRGSLKECDPLQSASMLYQILKRNNFLDDEMTEIIFCDLSWKQEYYYYPLLRAVISNRMVRYEDGKLLDIGQLDYLQDGAAEKLGEPLTGKYGEYSEHSFLRYTEERGSDEIVLETEKSPVEGKTAEKNTTKKKTTKEKKKKTPGQSPGDNRLATEDDLRKLAEAVNKKRL